MSEKLLDLGFERGNWLSTNKSQRVANTHLTLWKDFLATVDSQVAKHTVGAAAAVLAAALLVQDSRLSLEIVQSHADEQRSG